MCKGLGKNIYFFLRRRFVFWFLVRSKGDVRRDATLASERCVSEGKAGGDASVASVRGIKKRRLLGGAFFEFRKRKII